MKIRINVRRPSNGTVRLLHLRNTRFYFAGEGRRLERTGARLNTAPFRTPAISIDKRRSAFYRRTRGFLKLYVSIMRAQRVAFPRTDRADVLYYAGHNCVLPKPRDRQLPADAWVPLRDVLARTRLPWSLAILPPSPLGPTSSPIFEAVYLLIIAVCYISSGNNYRRCYADTNFASITASRLPSPRSKISRMPRSGVVPRGGLTPTRWSRKWHERSRSRCPGDAFPSQMFYYNIR
ncbi:hypothetical protein PUN28_018291 [Cardiocondyla obscurior]|uniref:Uncharacterized protein n=1 Tax=Cardiocondyla obscurior TaxID=286306 RepID=A0AAW2EKG9_9HYME